MKTFDPAWVLRKFITLFPRLIVAGVAILWVYYSIVYFSDWGAKILHGVKVIKQTPMGGDFSHYWIAARLALSGDLATVYDPARFQAAITAFFGVPSTLAWFYPPTFLLVMLPLGLLPYLTSLAAWLLTTLAAYLWVIRRIAPHYLTLLLALIFSATIQNFGFGQNGLLSTALLGGGLLLAESSPVGGGILLGLLTYKPHLAVLVPVALIAARRWKTLAAMLAGALGLILSSVLVFGSKIWIVYLTKSIPGVLQSIETGKVMNRGSLAWAKMPTIFSALHSAHLGLWPTVILQGIIMLAVTALVFRVWRQPAPLAVRGSVLVVGTLLFTPYLFIYDLCLLALPLAWIAWEGYKGGWLFGERYALFLCWVMPMFSETIAKASRIPIIPEFLILLLFLALRRKNARFENRFREVSGGRPGDAALTGAGVWRGSISSIFKRGTEP